MAKIRVGFSSDFNVRDTKVGFGTANPAALLDVADTLKTDFNITGVATLTAYGGFVAQKQSITEPSVTNYDSVGIGTFSQYYETDKDFASLGGVHHGDDQKFTTLSEDLVIEDGNILNITNTNMVGVTTIGEQDAHKHSSYVCASSLEEVSVTGHFSVPSGGNNDRQSFIEGTVRFNTDLNTLEFFNGIEWRQFNYNQGQSGRMLAGGGSTPGITADIQLININTLGNSQRFGELTLKRSNISSCSSATRGIWAGGAEGTYYDRIDYVTIASGGNALDFGNLTMNDTSNPPNRIASNRAYQGGASSSTRGLFGGGYQSSPLPASTVNIIDYVEMSTLGDSKDFGDLFFGRYSPGAVSNGVRAVWGGGNTPNKSVIDFVNIASKGDSVYFGDLTVARRNCGETACSNTVRGIFAGGQTPALQNVMDYITIAHLGNAVRFGDLTVSRHRSAASSTNIRGVWAGGSPALETIDYAIIATAGDAMDFGDLYLGSLAWGACSDSHGGLGGF
tara:strand:+ start:2126 stop:3643 length:1518 start_codon:yes stop_codon:yes gene_type:complete